MGPRGAYKETKTTYGDSVMRKYNISLIQDLIIDLEMDYQRMSRSGQEIYCLLSEAVGLDPVESNVRPYCDVSDMLDALKSMNKLEIITVGDKS